MVLEEIILLTDINRLDNSDFEIVIVVVIEPFVIKGFYARGEVFTRKYEGYVYKHKKAEIHTFDSLIVLQIYTDIFNKKLFSNYFLISSKTALFDLSNIE